MSKFCDVPLCLAGFSQPGGMGGDVALGAAPISGDRILSSTAEPPQPMPTEGSDAPKEHVPMRPEPQTPRSPLELSAGKHTQLPSTFAFLHNRPDNPKPFCSFIFFSTETLPTVLEKFPYGGKILEKSSVSPLNPNVKLDPLSRYLMWIIFSCSFVLLHCVAL